MAAMNPTQIIHVDMDAFFASVEQLDNPALKGQPVIVGGRPGGRGVVSAASYEARAFGVHSAMPLKTALRLCPQGIFLPVRFARYGEISKHIREIFHRYTPMVEPLSSDEAFLDVKGSEGLFGSAETIGRKIKEEILNETGLTASVGLGPNKFLAKLASDLRKPDGFVVITLDKIREILDPLPVGRLWGVGKKAELRLHALGYKTIGQIAAANPKALEMAFGPSAIHLWELAQGIDFRVVTPDRLAKSLSADITFSEDIEDKEVLGEKLLDLVEHLGSRLRKKEIKAAVIEVKLRSSDFETRSVSKSLLEPMNETMLLWGEAKALLQKLLKFDLLPARLISVSAVRLVRPGEIQGGLFDTKIIKKHGEIDRTLDAIKAKFGSESIGRGVFLTSDDKKSKKEQKEH
jgi:DNA polymerase-4